MTEKERTIIRSRQLTVALSEMTTVCFSRYQRKARRIIWGWKKEWKSGYEN